jgi:hypothetical protein
MNPQTQTWYYKLWKITVIVVGIYAGLTLSADFFGFGWLPYSLPVFLYLAISWVILKLVFKRNVW